jgi:hypothetical protein
MMRLIPHFIKKNNNGNKKKAKRKLPKIVISKRQKFVFAVIFLSLGLLISGNTQSGKYALHIAFSLALLTDSFLLWSIYKDIRENFAPSIFILPFFYSFASAMFYFLIPAGLVFRIPAALLYAFGLYSLLLSQNVFAVASIRTIALLSGARIVSFIITLLSYFFISNIIFSLHLSLIPMLILITVISYLLAFQSIRSYALQKADYPSLPLWVIGLTLCLTESAVILWFWPTNPTIIALFMTGFFYAITGLSHIWFERRLFRGVLWEYVWVGVVVFFVLIAFTQWGK